MKYAHTYVKEIVCTFTLKYVKKNIQAENYLPEEFRTEV
jgi:hypothetical protein